jgi:hypothetical protein
MKYMLRMSFPNTSNNQAEYEALLHGMRLVKTCGATRLKIFGDSNLVVQQVMNQCDALSNNMAACRDMYNNLKGSFDGPAVSHISRSSNKEADSLATIGSPCFPVTLGIFWEEISERSIKTSKPSVLRKSKEKPQPDSGASPASDDQNDDEEAEEVMMI